MAADSDPGTNYPEQTSAQDQQTDLPEVQALQPEITVIQGGKLVHGPLNHQQAQGQ